MVFSLPAYILLAGGVITAALAFKKPARPPVICASAALALAAWVVARALTSPVHYLARTDLLMVLAAVLVYFTTVMFLRDQRTRFTLVAVLVVMALAHVVVGAVQFKQADNFMPLPGIMRPALYEWRASGFYICPNHLAGLLEMIGLLSLGLACWSDSRPRARVLAGYCALMCLAGVAISGSRGGYLSIVFGLGVFAILSLWAVQLRRRGGFMLTLAALLFGTVLVLGGGLLFMSQSDTLRTRLAQVYDPTNMRFHLWKAALMQYHLQPVTGTGSGTYLYYGRQFRDVSVQNDPMHAHDDYLELLAEYGLVGAVLCGIFVLVHLCSGLSGLRRIGGEQIPPDAPGRSHELALVIGSLSAIGALLLHSVVDFNLHIPANALVVAFLFGLLATPMGGATQSDDAPIRRAGVWRWLVVAVALVLLAVSLRLWPGEIFAEKARVALRDDRNVDALGFAQRGLAWEKENPYLYGYLGDAQHFLTLNAPDPARAIKLHEDALAAYSAGLKLFPQDTALLLKQVQDFDQLERFAEAEQDFQRLFRFDPLFANVYAYYGLHWELQRRMMAAERCFRLAQRLGESEISPRALQNIERMKADPVSQAIMSALPDIDLDLPAERVLPTP